MSEDNKDLNLNDTDTLIKALQERNYGTFLIVVDDEDNEYTIEGIGLTMGGQLHPVIELKRVTNPRDKWFRTKEVYLEELEESVRLYESKAFRDDWKALHNGDDSKLNSIIEKRKRQIESVRKEYADGEIVD